MKTHLTELWAALFAFAFFPAAAQAQNVLRLYGGLAPTSYKISFDRNAPVGYSNQTAKSTYTAANVGLTWISPKGIYVDFAEPQRHARLVEFRDQPEAGFFARFLHPDGGLQPCFCPRGECLGFWRLHSERHRTARTPSTPNFLQGHIRQPRDFQ